MMGQPIYILTTTADQALQLMLKSAHAHAHFSLSHLRKEQEMINTVLCAVPSWHTIQIIDMPIAPDRPRFPFLFILAIPATNGQQREGAWHQAPAQHASAHRRSGESGRSGCHEQAFPRLSRAEASSSGEAVRPGQPEEEKNSLSPCSRWGRQWRLSKFRLECN